MRGRRYKSFQNWENGQESRTRGSRSQNFDKFKDTNNESQQPGKKFRRLPNGKRQSNQSNWTWREEEPTPTVLNPFSQSKSPQTEFRAANPRYQNLDSRRDVSSRPKSPRYKNPIYNRNFLPLAVTPPQQNTPSNYNINNTNSFVKYEAPIPLMALDLQPPFLEFPPNNFSSNHMSSTPTNRKRIYNDDESEINNYNEVKSIKMEKFSPRPTPQSEEKSLTPEVIEPAPEMQTWILDDSTEYQYEEHNSNSYFAQTATNNTYENSVVAETEPQTIPEVEQENHQPKEKTKKKRTRRKQDACEICDIQGHNEMQCQMICRNCKEPFHNSSKCSQPANTHNTLTSFMDFCVKQFMADTHNKLL